VENTDFTALRRQDIEPIAILGIGLFIAMLVAVVGIYLHGLPL
jgi:preprotein translocase subunit Sec61beta